MLLTKEYKPSHDDTVLRDLLLKISGVLSVIGLALSFLFCFTRLEAQEIVTASQFFDQISQRYGSLIDYTASVKVVQGSSQMEGTLVYQSPHRFRINFTKPQNQVICSDGNVLSVYIPRYNVGFVQSLKKNPSAGIAAMASNQGLGLLKAGYSIAYAEGPDLVPLDEDVPEKVVKLRLDSRIARQTFKQLQMAVTSTGLIRRISGVTTAQTTIQFDFTNMSRNTGITTAAFDYDIPPTANVIRNFLFDPEG